MPREQLTSGLIWRSPSTSTPLISSLLMHQATDLRAHELVLSASGMASNLVMSTFSTSSSEARMLAKMQHSCSRVRGWPTPKTSSEKPLM